MKHVEEHNKENDDSSLPCDLCDYKARTAKHFKEHIEAAHGIKVKENVQQNIPKTGGQNVKRGFCVFWNRGSCRFDDKSCLNEHKNIPACPRNVQ